MIKFNSINPYELICVPLENRHLLPDVRGVYFAIDNSNTIQYIGRSENINIRWKNETHHRYNELSRIQNVRLAYIEIPSTDCIEIIEDNLITKFKPVLNGKKVKLCHKNRLILKIKSLRLNHPEKPSQRFMGDYLGITESNYRKLETNQFISVKRTHLSKLVKFFNCSINELIGYIND